VLTASRPYSFNVLEYVLKRFQHPNIVVLFGFNVTAQQRQFLVYEYLHHGALSTFLMGEKGRTRLPSHIRLSIMYQLARSVHFLHTGGCGGFSVLHRDIKSGNICLTQNYTAKLIDCGLAKFVPKMDHDSGVGSVTPTMLKSSCAAVFGTPGYICPIYAIYQTKYVAAWGCLDRAHCWLLTRWTVIAG
jgi:serine/threonine protein kinase